MAYDILSLTRFMMTYKFSKAKGIGKPSIKSMLTRDLLAVPNYLSTLLSIALLLLVNNLNFGALAESKNGELEHPLDLLTSPDGLAKEEIKIYRYQPFYFLYGNPRSRVQISLLASPINEIPLFFGYTQRIKWSLLEVSIPIEEVQYHPDMFWRFDKIIDNTFVDIGVEHISNGKSGAGSHSLFQAFSRMHWQQGWQRWRLGAKFKTHLAFGQGRGLDEFVRHYGFWEAGFSLVQSGSDVHSPKFGMSVLFAFGGASGFDWRYGRQSLELRYDISPVQDPIYLTLVAEIGYAELLKEVDRYQRSLLLGISF